MIPAYRKQFNSAFTYKKYEQLLDRLTAGFEPLAFRVAETPVFLPADFVQKLQEAGENIIEFIKQADFKAITQGAIPKQWQVPGENEHPHFLTFDFAVCRDDAGALIPMLIELQGFPSLYGFQSHLATSYMDAYDLRAMADFSPYFNGMSREAYLALFRKVVIGPHCPEEVALVDVDVMQQKTVIDFLITAKEFGMALLSPEDIIREGDQLFYFRNQEKIRLKRIYNRLIFDELTDPEKTFARGFDPREELDIEWMTHPNWFYRISKYTMPFLKGDFVPDTQFLSEVKAMPEDLENYVLKPLFSFAGQGVRIDISPEDLQHIADPENWILQKKVTYAPVVEALDGGVKLEIRLMYLWPEGEAPCLCINLARLSRGKMIGVRYNKDYDWVGGTIGLMER